MLSCSSLVKMAQKSQPVSEYQSAGAAEAGNLGAEQAESTGDAWGFLNPVGPLPAPSRSSGTARLLWMSLHLLNSVLRVSLGLKPLDNQAAAKPRPNRFKEKAWLAVVA